MHREDKRFKSRFSIFLALVFLISSGFTPSPPNIVFILTDDQGLDAIEGFHWPNQLNVHTPALSKFSAQGRVFSQVRVNPICSPTRAAILTGRQAIHTGVVGLIADGQPLPDRDFLSLQSSETTIAEVLQASGYYTILADKWHLGWSSELDQLPLQQGFDEWIDGRVLWPLDDPEVIGDEHITRLVNTAVAAVNDRPRPADPYALFLWTKDPHKRTKDASGFKWWKMDASLHPSGEDYYQEPESNLNRFRGNIEALDTELGRLLQEIGVTDSAGNYIPSSNTLVIFMADGGTDAAVSYFGAKAKLTLFDGGIRVPMFAFGAGVPSDGALVDRLISQVDFFDTFADLADADDEVRGAGPRSSMSFADELGDFPPLPERLFALSSKPDKRIPKHSVALVSKQYKLIARGGGPGLEELSNDQFYDLVADPLEENNLLETGMPKSVALEYGLMRDALVDYWPIAVGKDYDTAGLHPPVGLKTFEVLAVEHATRASTGYYSENSLLHVGYVRRSHSRSVEARIYYKFDVARLPNIAPSNIVSVQLILSFEKDRIDADDTDTGPIRAYPMLLDPFKRSNTWQELEFAFDSTELGMVDLAPHILVRPVNSQLRGVPMPPQTPVSLGRNANLTAVVRAWLQDPAQDFGVVLIADSLPELLGDQHVVFRKTAALRVTVKRDSGIVGDLF